MAKPETFRVAFLIEGGETAGLGHVERSKVLATELARRGHRLTAAVRGPEGILAERGWPDTDALCVLPRGVPAAGSDELSGFLSDNPPAWVCIDGYGFRDDGSIKALGNQGPRTLAFEDDSDTACQLSANIVINQNTRIPDARTRDAAAEKILSGPEFALVDDAFRRARSQRPANELKRALITLGGSDPMGLTRPALDLLERAAPGELEIDLVVGPYFSDRGPFETQRHNVTIHQAPRTLAPLMAEADLVITAAGTTCWQACCLGRPIIAIVAAANQHEVARTLDDAGAALVCSAEDFAAPDFILRAEANLFENNTIRQAMADKARALVDGRGAKRIADAMGL